jgi:8-oxo-dGTP pyrophosphatase MutT (NUDIX family)
LGPGLWCLPGGRANPGEGFLECGLRELSEEVGAVHELELINTAGPFKDTLYMGKFDIHLLHYRWLGGNIVLSAEHVDFAWVGPDRYCQYDVVPGTDEDLAYLRVWPIETLNMALLPARLKPDCLD